MMGTADCDINHHMASHANADISARRHRQAGEDMLCNEWEET